MCHSRYICVIIILITFLTHFSYDETYEIKHYESYACLHGIIVRIVCGL